MKLALRCDARVRLGGPLCGRRYVRRGVSERDRLVARARAEGWTCTAGHTRCPAHMPPLRFVRSPDAPEYAVMLGDEALPIRIVVSERVFQIEEADEAGQWLPVGGINIAHERARFALEDKIRAHLGGKR